MSDIDTAAIHSWAVQDTELGTELASWQRYPGLGFDPDSDQLVDYSGEWATRDLLDMLDRDGTARAGEQALTLPLRSAPLTVKPAPGDRGEAAFVNDVLNQLDDPVDDLIGQAAQSLILRMTFLEKLWAVRDDRTVYRSFAWRPPESCAPLRDPATGALTGFKQRMTWWGGRNSTGGKPDYVNIGLDKGVVFVHGRAKDPIRGVSELTAAYQCYLDKQKIKFLWSVFLKGASIQRVIARTQEGAQTRVAQTLAKLASGGVAAVSANEVEDLTLLSASDSGVFFKDALTYLDGEMLNSILSGFLGLSGAATTGRGSFALSKDQSDFFLQAQDAAAKEISATIAKQIVRPLLTVNYGPTFTMPTVQLGPVSRATAAEQMTFLQALAAAPTGTLVPGEFVDELTVKIAGYLDLDVDKVAAAIRTAQTQTPTVPPVRAAVDATTRMTARALAGQNPLAAG